MYFQDMRMHFSSMTRSLFVLILLLCTQLFSEPVVINGSMIGRLKGKPLSSLRICDHHGKPVPFQIDEMTGEGEYVLPDGESPNTDSGNGVLDDVDEIVFLWEDCSIVKEEYTPDANWNIVRIERNSEIREVFISDDPSIPVSSVNYMNYDHGSQLLITPFYYAQFRKNRFHFIGAGVKNLSGNGFIDLTAELKIEIMLRALWGLIPIHYTEENIICVVKRYKAGPLRLIRRGDFHLNLGLGIKGSRAAVNQICYPQIVNVPVYVHVPIRFRSLFGDAYLDMAPVIKKRAENFSFKIPQASFSENIKGYSIDTMINLNPNHRFMGVTDGLSGYGWVLQATIPDSLLEGSGFLFSRPSSRSGAADCGFRIKIRDLQKGHYYISNWVIFPVESYNLVMQNFQNVIKPLSVYTRDGQFTNLLSAPAKKLKRK